MSTVRILKIDLFMLTKKDQRTRLEMWTWFNDKMKEDKDWRNSVWFSDETHFELDCYVNSKNCVSWGIKLPQELLQRP